MPFSADRPGFLLALWIVANLLAVGVYDISVLMVCGGRYRTVSSYLSDWASQFPVGVIIVGMIIGHLVWPSDSRPK